MLSLLELYYKTQKDVIFTDKLVSDKYTIYCSSKINDIYRNFAVISNVISAKNVLEDLAKDFKTIGRKPCIYINSSESAELRDLQERKWKVVYMDSWMRYEGKEIIPTKVIKEVKTETEKRDYLYIFENYYKGNINDVKESIADVFDEVLKKDSFKHFIAYDGKTPVAIASIGNYNGHYLIFNLACNPEHYGKGYRSSIISACIEQMKAVNGLSLNLKISANSNYEPWFAQNGFRRTIKGFGLIE